MLLTGRVLGRATAIAEDVEEPLAETVTFLLRGLLLLLFLPIKRLSCTLRGNSLKRFSLPFLLLNMFSVVFITSIR